MEKTLEAIKKGKSAEEVLELSIKEAADQIKRALEEGRIPSGEPFWDSRGRIEGILWKPGDKPIYKEKILCVLAEATKRGTPLGTSQIAKSVGLHILGCAQLLKELDADGKISTKQRVSKKGGQP